MLTLTRYADLVVAPPNRNTAKRYSPVYSKVASFIPARSEILIQAGCRFGGLYGIIIQYCPDLSQTITPISVTKVSHHKAAKNWLCISGTISLGPNVALEEEEVLFKGKPK